VSGFQNVITKIRLNGLNPKRITRRTVGRRLDINRLPIIFFCDGICSARVTPNGISPEPIQIPTSDYERGAFPPIYL
jgi:hypothetical protein